jgi:hypothetical protein
MQEQTVLLNGGRDQDVVPLAGTDAFLVRVLGDAPARPAVLYLRSTQNADGGLCVGVFLGSEHVGFFADDIDETLLATVQACEQDGAVVRARGSVVAASDCPGKVVVKVSLADSENLLNAPAPPPTTGGADDYPDWPPPKPKSAAAAPAGSFFAPTAPSAPTVAPTASAPVAPKPAPRTTTPPSPQELSSTRTAWLGGTPVAAQAPQSGWLAATVQSVQGSTAPAMATGAPATPGGGAGTPDRDQSWQTLAERQNSPRSHEDEVIAAWTSSPPRAQPVVPDNSPAPSGGTKPWIISALVVLVLLATAFLVWKTQFAPKTYTDEQYGYSFAYPGSWHTTGSPSMLESGIMAELKTSGMLLDASMAGLAGSSPQSDFCRVSVIVVKREVFGDLTQAATAFRQAFSDARVASTGGTILEPFSYTTAGGLNGFRITLSLTAGASASTMTYCWLIGDDLTYVLAAASNPSSWSGNQKAFDKFFESFKPGTAKI